MKFDISNIYLLILLIVLLWVMGLITIVIENKVGLV